MSVIKLEAVTADADGRLRLDLPARPGWRYNVQVIVSVAPPIPPEATPEERGGWPPGYAEKIMTGFGDADGPGFDALMHEYGHPGDADPASGR